MECSERKPNCHLLSILLVSRYAVSLRATIFSKIFEKELKRDIGLYLSMLPESPFLKLLGPPWPLVLLPAGLHRGDDDQVDAVGHQHLHREPGHGRHVGHALLRPALRHLGRDEHLDIRFPDV